MRSILIIIVIGCVKCMIIYSDSKAYERKLKSKGAFIDKISDNIKEFDSTVWDKIKEASDFAKNENGE